MVEIFATVIVILFASKLERAINGEKKEPKFEFETSEDDPLGKALVVFIPHTILSLLLLERWPFPELTWLLFWAAPPTACFLYFKYKKH